MCSRRQDENNLRSQVITTLQPPPKAHHPVTIWYNKNSMVCRNKHFRVFINSYIQKNYCAIHNIIRKSFSRTLIYISHIWSMGTRYTSRWSYYTSNRFSFSHFGMVHVNRSVTRSSIETSYSRWKTHTVVVIKTCTMGP